MRRITIVPLFLLMLITSSAWAQDKPTIDLDIVLLVDPASISSDLDKVAFDAFLGGIEDTHRISVVAMGKEIKVVTELTPAQGITSIEYAKNNLVGLELDTQCKNLNAGLQKALDILLAKKRNNTRAIITIGTGPLCIKKTDKESIFVSDGLLFDLRSSHVMTFSVALGAKDADELKNVAIQTSGRYLTANKNDNLSDVLTTIYGNLQFIASFDLLGSFADIMSKKERERKNKLEKIDKELLGGLTDASRQRTILSQEIKDAAAKPMSVLSIMAIALIVLIILGALVFLALHIIKLSQKTSNFFAAADDPRTQSDEETETSFTRLKMGTGRIAKDFDKVHKNFKELHLDLEDFGIETWEAQNKAQRDYTKVMENIFLLLDHLGVQSGGEDDWTVRKLAQLLSDENIEEIPVKPGDMFDSMCHNNSDDREDSSPAGTVLEIVRKGYRKDHNIAGQEEQMLRLAEVIVSRG